MKNVMAICSTILLASCGSTYAVYQANEKQDDSKGVYYYLPKNIIKVDIPVTVTEKRIGRWKKYNKTCLHNNDLPTKYSTDTVVTIDAPTMTLIAQPDLDQQYFVDITASSNPFRSLAGTFELSSDQILNGATAKVSDTTYDFTVSLATIAARGFAVSGLSPAQKAQQTDDKKNKANADQDCKAYKKIEKQIASLAQDLRTSVSIDVYKELKANLTAQAQTLYSYFTVESSVQKTNWTFYVEPQQGWSVDKSIGLIGDDRKPLAHTKIGKNTYRVDDSVSCDTSKHVCVRIKAIKNNAGKYTKGAGLVYRLPGRATVSVESKNEIKGEQSLVIAQFGSVNSLPSRFGAISSELSTFTLDPLTGGLKSLGINGSGLSTEQGTALTNYIAAKKAEDDEVTRLTEEKTILTLKQEIKALKSNEN